MARLPLLIALLLIVPAATASAALTAEDIAAVRQLEAAYVGAWVKNDRSAVLATIADDAVIVPSGLAPIYGVEAISSFWWPSDGPATRVTSYRTTVADVMGDGDYAYCWGSGELFFEMESGGERTAISRRSRFTMIASRGGDGRWRIAYRSWIDLR